MGVRREGEVERRIQEINRQLESQRESVGKVMAVRAREGRGREGGREGEGEGVWTKIEEKLVESSQLLRRQ